MLEGAAAKRQIITTAEVVITGTLSAPPSRALQSVTGEALSPPATGVAFKKRLTLSVSTEYYGFICQLEEEAMEPKERYTNRCGADLMTLHEAVICERLRFE